jgi:hypothetical protein
MKILTSFAQLFDFFGLGQKNQIKFISLNKIYRLQNKIYFMILEYHMFDGFDFTADIVKYDDVVLREFAILEHNDINGVYSSNDYIDINTFLEHLTIIYRLIIHFHKTKCITDLMKDIFIKKIYKKIADIQDYNSIMSAEIDKDTIEGIIEAFKNKLGNNSVIEKQSNVVCNKNSRKNNHNNKKITFDNNIFLYFTTDNWDPELLCFK